jgi:hypothetical protein
MTAVISHTTIDAADAYAQSLFWATVLGYAQDPDDPNEPGLLRSEAERAARG